MLQPCLVLRLQRANLSFASNLVARLQSSPSRLQGGAVGQLQRVGTVRGPSRRSHGRSVYICLPVLQCVQESLVQTGSPRAGLDAVWVLCAFVVACAEVGRRSQELWRFVTSSLLVASSLRHFVTSSQELWRVAWRRWQQSVRLRLRLLGTIRGAIGAESIDQPTITGGIEKGEVTVDMIIGAQLALTIRQCTIPPIEFCQDGSSRSATS